VLSNSLRYRVRGRAAATQAAKFTALLILVLAVSVLLAPLAAEAQRAGQKVPRIGYLDGASLAANPNIEAFRQGLRQFGYVEGQNIVIEWRSSEGREDRLPGLAAELVRLNVDVIVTGGSGATRPAKEVTTTIPIVMAQDSDPVESGFVMSLARPGGNITGLATLHPAVSAKRLEILKEMVPRLSRVALFGTSTWSGNAHGLRETELAAGALGIKLQYLDVVHPKDFETAFQGAAKGHAEAGVMLVWGPLLNARRKEVAELAVKRRLPMIYRAREHVQAGGLLAYGPNIPDLFQRAAIYVDKILKGAKPADLPVEQPTKFELVINMKTAKALGLMIPPSLLLRAHQVID
jgi:putative ABC transport system substrate-binding protein